MIFVFFIYGLAFFILGFAILLYPKKDSVYILADKLWLIAGFGIVHGINEWIDMFLLIQKPVEMTFLKVINLPFLAASFLFLIWFGVATIIETKNKYSLLKSLPIFLFVTWVVLTILSSQKFLSGNVYARYLLGIPGTFLTAYALFLQLPEFKKSNKLTIIRNLKLATGGFLFYGFFSGFIVPKAGFFPASIFNYTTFSDIIGSPVQVFRSICAVVITYAVIRVLSIFQFEVKTKIRNSFEEIQKAYVDLKTLEKTKDSLTQMIVHDLNNPLMVISGNIQLLGIELRNILSGDQKKVWHTMLYVVKEMGDMISNLLDISKMEEGKINLRYEEINLDVILKEITDVMGILAQQEEKGISVRTSPEPVSLYADRGILKRVISNLIGNALKFAPSGSTVEITARYNKDAKEVMISVKDQGQGIPKEYLQRVFEKFVQVESAQIKEKTGKGLGLTFCKMAVEAHKGRIWVESELGKGSTFYLTLPTNQNLRVS